MPILETFKASRRGSGDMLVILIFAAVGLLSAACLLGVLYLGSLCQREGVTIVIVPEPRSPPLNAIFTDEPIDAPVGSIAWHEMENGQRELERDDPK